MSSHMWHCGARQDALSTRTAVSSWPAMSYGGELARMTGAEVEDAEVVQNAGRYWAQVHQHRHDEGRARMASHGGTQARCSSSTAFSACHPTNSGQVFRHAATPGPEAEAAESSVAPDGH